MTFHFQMIKNENKSLTEEYPMVIDTNKCRDLFGQLSDRHNCENNAKCHAKWHIVITQVEVSRLGLTSVTSRSRHATCSKQYINKPLKGNSSWQLRARVPSEHDSSDDVNDDVDARWRLRAEKNRKDKGEVG